MSLAGEAEVLFVAKHEPGRPARLGGDQCREQGRQCGLRLFPAEAAAHPPADADDLVQRQAQRMGDDRLNLARVLRGRMDRDLTRFAGDGEGGLRLQVEMLLPADGEFAA